MFRNRWGNDKEWEIERENSVLKIFLTVSNLMSRIEVHAIPSLRLFSKTNFLSKVLFFLTKSLRV